MNLIEGTPQRTSASGTVDAKTRRKLIEVALPLERINEASAWEKGNPFIKGHPRNLHHWWARRPLAAARAVIFSQMVDDPSEYTDELLANPATRERAVRELRVQHELWEARRPIQAEVEDLDLSPEPTLEQCAADLERQRLFRLIEQLVKWENTTNELLLEEARAEIRRSWRRTCADNRDHPRAADLFDPERLPAFHDPFAGGGALPLEAQRLGLEAHASDLNPVAVLINKAMIEIPPTFAGRAPVNPESRSRAGHSGTWARATGLAEDVRYYGRWMRDEAERRIGRLYPPIEVTAEMAKDQPDLRSYVGRKLTVIAWLWARTVKSPNPAFANVDVPLVSTFMLSTKPGKEAYVEPIIADGAYRFRVCAGQPRDLDAVRLGTSAGKRAAFRCLLSGVPVTYDHIRSEATAGRMGARLLAIVAQGDRGRLFLPPTHDHETAASRADPTWRPDVEFFQHALGFRVGAYGLATWADLYTARQLVALTTLTDLLKDVSQRVQEDLGESQDSRRDGRDYADAIVVYLACAIDQLLRYHCNLAKWNVTNANIGQIFGLQTVQMVWDFAEANAASGALDMAAGSEWVAAALEHVPALHAGTALARDARTSTIPPRVVSTDPPYYDNVGYADLSDFFYVWMRRSLAPKYPDLLATIATPKDEELVATPIRHGSSAAAEDFFLHGMVDAMSRLAVDAHPAFPTTVYYAFRQVETSPDEGTASTGWETFLEAVIASGFAVSATWPVRTERRGRLRETGSNALASSIVLVCRRRPVDAPRATRREFMAALRRELPVAIRYLQATNTAPVDLAQAAIGPGMRVFTRYRAVLKADAGEGEALNVREALALINRVLDEVLTEQEGDFDPDSRFALAWFAEQSFGEGEYGIAEVLARAKNTSLAGMEAAGILVSRHGKVRLLTPSELDPSWDPASDARRPAWQTVHQLVLAADRSEEALAALIAKLGSEADTARELAYRLYVLCDRKKRATEAGWYNGLVQSWSEAMRLASERPAGRPVQEQLFGEG